MTEPAGRERVALVTGGSRGIGQASAVRLARDHAGVVIAYRSAASEAKQTVRAIERAGAEGVAVRCDLAGAERAGPSLVDACVERFGRLDSVVNNAGISEPATLLEMPFAVWQRTIDTNLSAAFSVLLAAARVMAEGDGGAIVNVGSPAALRGGNLTGAHYAASKAGLIGLTVQAATELAPHRIRVNLVEPTAVATDMVRSFMRSGEALPFVSPAGRLGEPPEVAEVIAFLCSEGASYVSGARIAVTGGG